MSHTPSAGARVTRRSLLTALGGTVAAASVLPLSLSASLAAPTPPAPPAPPASLDRQAFWSLPVLETGVDVGLRTEYGRPTGRDGLAYVAVELNQELVQQQALEAIRDLRREAFARDDVLFRGEPLRAYLRRLNIRDAETYALRIGWREASERIAVQRVAELGARFHDDRPNGARSDKISTLGPPRHGHSNGFHTGSFEDVRTTILETWGREQLLAFIASRGNYAPGTTELRELLNPDTMVVGVAASRRHVYFATGTSPHGGFGPPVVGSFRVLIAVDTDLLPAFTLSAPSWMQMGEAVTLEVRNRGGPGGGGCGTDLCRADHPPVRQASRRSCPGNGSTPTSWGTCAAGSRPAWSCGNRPDPSLQTLRVVRA